MHDFKISDYLHSLRKQMFRITNNKMMKYGISPQQGRIVRFLALQKDEEIFQKDIEEFLNTRKSSVSSILKNLEKTGLIKRANYQKDGRFKQIKLTENGLLVHEEAIKNYLEIEEKMRNNLNQHEIKILENILKKMIDSFEN